MQLKNAEKLNILVVDDHEAMRRGIKGLLADREDWCVCGEAANGLEALDKLALLRPDLVILDLSMPVMGGVEAARRIRKIAPQTKIIIYSTHDAPEIRIAAVLAGAHAYVSKSQAADDLPATIDRVLKSSRNNRAVNQAAMGVRTRGVRRTPPVDG
jgi:DNA-binding NarL/FixJ family response regulator